MTGGTIRSQLLRLIRADKVRLQAEASQITETKQVPLRWCPSCRGTWFRQATFERFVDCEHQKERYAPLGGKHGCMPMTALICLCGNFVPPELGGVRSGRIAKVEVMKFCSSAELAKRQVAGARDIAARLKEARDPLASKVELNALRSKLTALEKSIGRALSQKEDGGLRRGPRWSLPKRRPTSRSKGRDWLVLRLQEVGLSFLKAREVVHTIFDAIKDGLKAGEAVYTPLGKFLPVKRGPKPCARFRFGRTQVMFKRRTHIRFVPEPAARNDVDSEGSSREMVASKNDSDFRCEECGASHFSTAGYRQYIPGYSSSPSGDAIANEGFVSIRTCLCGNHVSAENLASLTPSERQDLLVSLTHAQEHRAQTDLEHLKADFRQEFAQRAELEVLREKVDRLLKAVSNTEAASRGRKRLH